MTRNLHIDALKGIAILLVVLGHAIEFHTPDFDNNAIFRWIYSFHMPLFMFLSGYLAFGKPINLKKKALTLALPFIAWHQVTFVIKNLSDPYPIYYLPFMKELFWSPGEGLWFLWVLFLIFCLFFLIQIVSRSTKKIPQEVLAIGLYLLFQKILIYHYGFTHIKWHFLYFALGYFFVKYRRQWRLPAPVKGAIILLAPFIGITWSRVDNPLFWPLLQTYATHFRLPGLSVLLYMYKTFVVPLMGITFMYLIIPKKGGYIYIKKLCTLGTMSLEIYALQAYFTTASAPGNQTAQVIGIFGLALAYSIALALLIRKSAFLSLIMFGRRSKTVQT